LIPIADKAFQIRGLGPITISVPELAGSDRFLTEVMAMRRARNFTVPYARAVRVHVSEMGEGGPAAELHVRVEPDLLQSGPGAGGVHHVAFRVRDQEYGYWVDRLRRLRVPSSGPVDRFYFRSLYTHEPNGILYEIATEGPGFATDEPLEALGDRLSLPPFLEPQRAAIEHDLKPL
jgi:glyoxalase family protein